MAEDKIYDRGLYHQLKDDIETLQTQINPTKKEICLLACADEIEVKSLKALLDDYEVKRVKLSDMFKKLYEIKDKWGFE